MTKKFFNVGDIKYVIQETVKPIKNIHIFYTKYKCVHILYLVIKVVKIAGRIKWLFFSATLTMFPM